MLRYANRNDKLLHRNDNRYHYAEMTIYRVFYRNDNEYSFLGDGAHYGVPVNRFCFLKEHYFVIITAKTP